MWEQQSGARVVAPARPRKLAKVPFVELADGRVQGVVSSGSGIERGYGWAGGAGGHADSGRPNKHRPCGGARGRMCKHLETLIDEAILQFGLDRVARYLRVDLAAGPDGRPEVIKALHGPASTAGAAAAAPVFSRFLRHLAYLE